MLMMMTMRTRLPIASVDTDGECRTIGMKSDDILISESTLTLDEDDDNDGFTDEEELADGSDPTNADSTPFVPMINSAP